MHESHVTIITDKTALYDRCYMKLCMWEMSWRIVIILYVFIYTLVIFRGVPGCNEESSVMYINTRTWLDYPEAWNFL